MAIFRTSSIATLNRPSIAAIALPAWIKNWPARGPAPKSSSSFTTSGAFGSAGRVALTSATTDSTTNGLTATLATSFWMFRIALCREHLAHFGFLAAGGGEENFFFFVGARIPYHDVKHESVQLRFWQRIRSLLFDGILGSDREKWVGQWYVCRPTGHFSFLHRLE